MNVASPPALRMRAMVSFSVPGRLLSPASAVRAVQTTLAPSIARRTEIASPMPRLAPVTSATRPFNLPFGLMRASVIVFSLKAVVVGSMAGTLGPSVIRATGEGLRYQHEIHAALVMPFHRPRVLSGRPREGGDPYAAAEVSREDPVIKIFMARLRQANCHR